MNEQYRNRANHLETISAGARGETSTYWTVSAEVEQIGGTRADMPVAHFDNPSAAAALEGEIKRRTEAAVAAVHWAEPIGCNIERIVGATVKRQRGAPPAGEILYTRLNEFMVPFRYATGGR
jgi:hypothetical protein